MSNPLFEFKSTNATDLQSSIRQNRRQAYHRPTNTVIPHHNKKQPFLIRCLCPFVVALVIVYVILFIEIDEVNLWKFIKFDNKTNPNTNQDIVTHKSNSNSNEQSLQSSSSFSDKIDKINDEMRQLYANDKNGPKYGKMDYYEMWKYIDQTAFKELTPNLQTMHLHELFRYKFNKLLSDRMKRKEFKIPSDHDLASLLTDIYTQYGTQVNFIQVGSCDGDWEKSNDPIQKLILKHSNWNGVMMEPVPYIFDTLKGNIEAGIPNHESRIVPLNAALSDHDGTQVFYTVNQHFSEELPNESHALKFQIGSFNKQHIVKHIKVKKERGQLKEELDYYISAIDVTSMTANTVVDTFEKSGKAARNGNIDVLTIDAEGYDYVVLSSFLRNTTIRPLLVMYEHLHLQTNDARAAVQLLNENGYIDFPMHWNTLGVRAANV